MSFTFPEGNSIGGRKRQSLQCLEGCLKDVAVGIFSPSSSSEDAVVQLCKLGPCTPGFAEVAL